MDVQGTLPEDLERRGVSDAAQDNEFYFGIPISRKIEFKIVQLSKDDFWQKYDFW